MNLQRMYLPIDEMQRLAADEVWVNSTYQVIVRNFTGDSGGKHLSIKRNDREPIHDWRDLQAIKNALCGDEWEGMELYPAESRVVDMANQYHLWCFPFKIPMGFEEGRRIATPDEAAAHGAKQRAR